MSSSGIALAVDGVSKRYVIGQAETHRYLGDAIIAKLRRKGSTGVEHWALRDVSFSVEKGDVVGIIGRNGAGKSTLLKILSQIAEPTEGEIRLYGRVGSLLEVGTGFHPELTGRENIYLNGTILGMRRREVERHFDAIVEFAEVSRFLDTPVKRYSSGMYVRLAFAVAAHLDSEILVVDEVLAVGDAQFQRKCLGKMGDVAASGRTVLFVSHSMQAVSSLTRKCVVMSAGRTQFVGDTSEAISHYLSQGASPDVEYFAEPKEASPKITHARLDTSHPDNVQGFGDSMSLALEFNTPFPIDGCRLNIKALDSYGATAFQAWCHHTDAKPLGNLSGVHRVTVHFPKCRLYQGAYSLKIHLSAAFGVAHYEVLESVCPFTIEMMEMNRDGGWPVAESAYVEDYGWEATTSSHALSTDYHA